MNRTANATAKVFIVPSESQLYSSLNRAFTVPEVLVDGRGRRFIRVLDRAKSESNNQLSPAQQRRGR